MSSSRSPSIHSERFQSGDSVSLDYDRRSYHETEYRPRHYSDEPDYRIRRQRDPPTYRTGSSGPISYKLNLNYKGARDNEVLLSSAYVNDRPFNLPPVCASEDKKQTSKEPVRTDHAFEVVTDAFVKDMESRYSSRDRPADLTSDEMMQDVGLLSLTKVCRTRLIIRSPQLRQALGLIIRYYPGNSWISDPSATVIIFEPYSVLLHHFDEIESFIARESKRIPNPENDDATTQIDRDDTVRDMVLLLGFLRPLHVSVVTPAVKFLAHDVPTINFDMLWYLFRPGTDVWIQEKDTVSMAVVHKFKYKRDDKKSKWSSTESSEFSLHLWRLSTDGNRVARTSVKHKFERFPGQMEINALAVCPVSYWDATDHGARRQSTLARNRLLEEVIREGSLHVHYDEPNNIDSVMPGKMVVDFLRPRPIDTPMGFSWPRFDDLKDLDPALESYDYIFLSHSKPLPPEPQTLDDDDWGFSSKKKKVVPTVDSQKKALLLTTQMTEHQLLLLPYRVPAFSLNTKKWHAINTAYMSKVEPSNDSINNLVMSESALKTITALASRQDRNTAKATWSADFIQGKGIGQIILLHGPPGVGKTYTVEAVSEWLRRPFLPLTVADLGTIETSIEQNLTTWFDLAEVWNAVLLVDEADIFLEQRKNKDLYRNGLVTAFLRRMEYFKGLLFLTTNRVGQIDDAFISRVHVAIEYPALTPSYRSRIWKAFFAKLHTERKGKIKVSPRAQAYVLGKEMELNGREIRNALQAAIALAEYEARTQEGLEGDEMVTVEQGHFEDVLGMCESFHKYVGSIRREDEKKRASGRGDRNDYGD